MREKIKACFQKRQAQKQVKMRQEFLPEALEIVEKPTSPTGHLVILIVVVIVAFFLAWSVLGRMDEVVTARGRVLTISGVQEIQVVNTGVVKEICVAEGDFVTTGQPILIVDSSINEITLQNTTESLDLLQLETELLNKLLEDEDVSAEVAGGENGEGKEVLDYVLAIQAEYQAQREELNMSIEQTQSQLTMEQQNREKTKLAIGYKEAEVADYQDLYEAGAMAKAELTAAQLELEQLRKDLVIQESAISLSEQQQEQAVQSLASLEADYRANLSKLIVENEIQINDSQSNLEIQTINMEQQTLVSPVDGIVKTLEVNTTGGVLTTAQTVATVVPDGAQMIIEADILNKDVGSVQLGQSVAIKLDALNFQKFGKVEGVIVSISPDAVLDQQKGWVYKAKIAIDEENFKERNPGMEIGIGMECTAEVKIGERKIIDFFLEPIVEHFDGSLKVQ